MNLRQLVCSTLTVVVHSVHALEFTPQYNFKIVESFFNSFEQLSVLERIFRAFIVFD